MRDYEDPPIDQTAQTLRFPERRHESSPGGAIALVALLVAVVAGGAWYLLRRPAVPRPDLSTRPAAAAPTAEAAPAPATPAERTFVLPALEGSDAVVRELVARLSANPQLAAWFANDELIRRFVATVANLAEGASPATHVRFLTPDEGFHVRDSVGRATIDPASYRRYDLATEAFTSLDAAGTAKLYRDLQPLLDQAYQELGYPGRSFDEAMARAIDRLANVEVPSHSPEVVAQGASGLGLRRSGARELERRRETPAAPRPRERSPRPG